MTDTLTVLGPAQVRRWFEQGLRSLLAVRRQVDVLNVFPVPDGDTGTNLVLTLAGAARSAAALGPHAGLGELTAAAARGALVGARGNSGVILSQAMRGLARATAGRESLDARALAEALTAAAEEARRAVARPVEGTVLTVADAAALAAREVVGTGSGAAGVDAVGDAPGGVRATGGLGHPGADVAEVAAAAARAAEEALAGTRSQLAVLAERDVVDAGAAGYVILLAALASVLDDDAAPAPARAREALASLWSVPRPAATGPACALGGSVVDPGGAAAYEVMYVLHATVDAADELRARLAAAGESVAVVGGADGPGARGLWQVHVHTDEPAAVLAAPADVEQVGVRPLTVPPLGVVACTRLPGLAAPLAATGACVVVHPDPAGLERGVVDAGAADVLVLPCDEESAVLAAGLPGAAASGDAPLPGAPRVAVAGTRDEVAVLAVVGEQQPAAGATERRDAAADVVARLRTAGCAAADVADAARRLLGPGTEVLTAVVGTAAGPGTPARARVEAALGAVVAAAAPLAEVVVLDGGQATPDVLLGVQ